MSPEATTYVLLHGGTASHCWELVAARLRVGGHEVLTIELPGDGAPADQQADRALAAIGDRRHLVVVAHAVGDGVLPLLCRRAVVELLVVVAGIVPQPSDAPMPDAWPVDAWADVPTHYVLGDEGAFWFPEGAADLAGRVEALSRMRAISS